MLHHARVVLAMGEWGRCALVHFSTCSLLHFCPSQQPIHLLQPQFPSLSTITVFPFSALTFSHFQVMTLIGAREPDSSSPHPSSSKWKSSAQLFCSHSTRLFDSTTVQSFSNASFPAVTAPSVMLPPLPPSIYSSKLIIFVAPLHPPTIRDLHVFPCAFVVFLSLHNLFSPYLSFHLHRWAPFLLLCSQDRVC